MARVSVNCFSKLSMVSSLSRTCNLEEAMLHEPIAAPAHPPRSGFGSTMRCRGRGRRKRWASLLIRVLARRMAASVTSDVVLAIIWPDHGVRDHLGAVGGQGARCAAG